jgi:ParB family chromosome partitioning protein
MIAQVTHPDQSLILRPTDIEIPATARPCDASEVSALAESIATMGLQTAPTVVERDGHYVLVAGRHRIEALKLLGVESVPVRLVEMDDLDARMWAISENLHRAELTVLQRSQQVEEYADLAKQKRETEGALQVPDLPEKKHGLARVSVQVAQKPGRPESGDSLAARKLGIRREEVIRSHRIAKLSDEAKKEAEASGLDDNQSALLKAAKASTPEAQVGVLRDIKVRGRVKKTRVPSHGPIDEVMRELITRCAGPKAEWRTRTKMSWITRYAASAIKEALERLGDAVKTRPGDRDDEYLIEGNRNELFVRAGLMSAQSDQSAADPGDELANLRAENADLRAKLADAESEIERLKNALHEEVIEKIAAKHAANGQTKPTVDDVVMAALG